jgi:PKD domain-containing protein
LDVTITGGNSQSTPINTPFSNALAVHVTANDSNLTNLSGGVITFIAPVTGATVVLGTNQLIASVVLGSAGTASVSATADDTAGSYEITASATLDATSSTNSFALTNSGTTPSVPTLSISGPSTATGGLAYTLTLNTSDATQNIPLTWYINWGDGSAIQEVTGENNNDLQPVTHTFATSPGNFTITAIATDGTNIYAAGEQQVNEDNEGATPPGPVQAEALSTDLVELSWHSVSGTQYYQVTFPPKPDPP